MFLLAAIKYVCHVRHLPKPILANYPFYLDVICTVVRYGAAVAWRRIQRFQHINASLPVSVKLIGSVSLDLVFLADDRIAWLRRISAYSW